MDWVALSSKDYAAASFLDRRALSVTSSDHYFSMPIANASTCPEEHPNNLRWIFHVGHCGSTALSKLLGFHPEVLSLREPDLWGLNALWRDDPTTAPEWFPLCQAILKRGFEATSTVLVKPSSLQTEPVSSSCKRINLHRASFTSSALLAQCPKRRSRRLGIQ